MIVLRYSPDLRRHLETFVHDGATVASALFEGGRLCYPGRRRLEHELNFVEPYTLEHEARVIEGFPPGVAAAVRLLSHSPLLTCDGILEEPDPTLSLLWASHGAWVRNGISTDRLVVALAMCDHAMSNRQNELIETACEVLIRGMDVEGFPPSHAGLEELFDGAYPACVGLGLIEL